MDENMFATMSASNCEKLFINHDHGWQVSACGTLMGIRDKCVCVFGSRVFVILRGKILKNKQVEYVNLRCSGFRINRYKFLGLYLEGSNVIKTWKIVKHN